ncbi:MAG: hypothetical protein GY714_15165 [Desulfobacterales bacterium]|nr:hypothetical protein [Desulfobacterales bacterium]
MPLDLNYKINIGSQCAGGKDDDRLMVSLTTELGMDCGFGYSVIELADEKYTLPSPGDQVTIELGDGLTKVFTGEVETVETIKAGQRITAYDATSKLAGTEIETTYKEVSIDEIVSDLISEVGLKAGVLEKSARVPSFTIFKGPRVFQHIQKLAKMSGMDLFSNGEGLLNFAGPKTKGKNHTFEYGLNILELNVKNINPFHDGIEITGEGSAGTKGADRYYWLPDDLSGIKGVAAVDEKGKTTPGKSVKTSTCEVLPAFRSGEAVEKIAESRMDAKASLRIRGYLKIYGYPEVMPGDTASIKKLPENHITSFFNSGGNLRIRNVKHLYNLQNGFITRMDF